MGVLNVIPDVRATKNWSPGELGTLFGWYDLSDATNVFTDAGITPVSLDADPIYQVNDKSGLRNHLIQATLGNRPLWKTNILGSKSVARFVSSDALANPLAATYAQPGTVLVVASNPDTGADSWLISDQTAPYGWIMYRTNGAPDKWSLYSGSVLLGSATPDNNPHIFVGIFNGATSKLYVDGGAPDASGAVGAGSLVNLSIGTTVGGTGAPITGDVAEVVLYNSVLAAADINRIGSYFALKYALTWSTVS